MMAFMKYKRRQTSEIKAREEEEKDERNWRKRQRNKCNNKQNERDASCSVKQQKKDE